MAKLKVVAHDTEAELREKLRHAHDEAFKNRVKAILLAMQKKKRYEICRQLTADPKSVTLWIHRYNGKGTNALISNKGGRPKGNPKWEEEPFKKLAEQVNSGGYWSIPRMQQWLAENFTLVIPEQTVWYRMDQLGYSYKSARPHPVKGDRGKQEVFKKGGLYRSWSR